VGTKSVAAAFAICWMGLAWCWWDRYVPAIPTAQLPMDGEAVVGITNDNELVTCSTRPITDAPPFTPRSLESGPFRYWRFPEAKVVREVAVAGTFHLTEAIANNLSILHAGGRNLVFDFGSGKVIDDIAGELKTVRLVDPGKGLVYVTDIKTTTVRNVREHATVWQKLGYPHQWAFVGPEFLMLAIEREGPDAPGDLPVVRLVDTQTGEHVKRFDPVGGFIAVKLIGHQRYVLLNMFDGNKYPICDFRTGKRLWDLQSRHGYFTPHGDEWRMPWCDERGNVSIERTRMQDGTRLTPARPADSGAKVYRVDQAGPEYVIDLVERDSPGETIAETFNRWSSRVRGPRVSVPEREKYFQLTHEESSRRAGVLDLNNGWSVPDPIWLPNGTGVLIPSGSSLHFYTLPPQRNWCTLIAIGLVPAIVGLSLLVVRRG